MTYRIQGILKLPDGAPAANCEIEFVSRKNFSPLVQGAKTNILTSAVGAYDVTLELGEYAVILYTGGTYPAQAGIISVLADTTTGLDLPTLLGRGEWQPATPDYIKQIEGWLVSSQGNANAAAASADRAESSAALAGGSEIAAKASATSAAASEASAKADALSSASSAAAAKASEISAAADAAAAGQSASSAEQSRISAATDAVRAENAAGSMIGAILDGGACDLSAGVYPTPIAVNGSPYSTVWYAQTGGTVSGTTFDAGDLLRYTTANGGQYFRVDAKDEVYSVNGKKGAVTLSSIDVGADASGTADSAVSQHEAKQAAHQISGVSGLQAALDEKYSPNNKPTAADVGALGINAAEPGSGALMRVGGPAILDAERYALERASGGRQTIIRDAAGASNFMFVLPRFTYADLGMSADMGSGDVTAFDFGSGSIKSEIFIGAYLASGSGAVSAPRQDPRGFMTHTSARDACTAKGAGWHLMTAHEWAAIALWCMANGYEPIGNTNWGRSHAKTWLIGDRVDGMTPGDASGSGRTLTGSIGPEANHDKSPHGIADLVGNMWEWQDGFLLQDGRFKISAHNTQAEANWSFIDAYLDASTTTGGVPILSNQIINRLGAIGDNANTGNAADADWRAMTKSGGYVSNQLLRRLLLEPSLTLPQGRIYMRNFGERLPFRGGDWGNGADAGLAAVNLNSSRVDAGPFLGFRPAFAS